MSNTPIAQAWRALTDAARAAASVLGGALKVLLALLIGAVFIDYFHQGIVIRPIGVTKAMTDNGISDVVAAQELRQRIYQIRQVASLNDRVKLPAALSAEQPDIPVPTTSISINTIFDLLDDVLPWSPRTVVSGDFTSDGKNLRLALLMNRREVYSREFPGDGAAEYLLNDAATAIVTDMHPEWEALDLDQNGRARDANRLMDRVIYGPDASSSDVAQARLLRAWFLEEESDLPDACDEIKASLSQNPDNADAYQGLSSLLVDENRPDLALPAAERAVVLSWGRDSFAYYALGRSYYGEGDAWPDAERAYRESIHLWRGNRFAYDALGRAEENEGAARNIDALDEYSAAIVLKPEYVQALEDRARLLTYKIKTVTALAEAAQDFELGRQTDTLEPSRPSDRARLHQLRSWAKPRLRRRPRAGPRLLQNVGVRIQCRGAPRPHRSDHGSRTGSRCPGPIWRRSERISNFASGRSRQRARLRRCSRCARDPSSSPETGPRSDNLRRL